MGAENQIMLFDPYFSNYFDVLGSAGGDPNY